MEKAKEEYQSYVSDYFRRGAMREMPDHERQTIIDGTSFFLEEEEEEEEIFLFRSEETMGRRSSRVSDLVGDDRHRSQTLAQRTSRTSNATVGERHRLIAETSGDLHR